MSPPHIDHLTSCFVLLKNGPNLGQVLNVVSVGMSEGRCADPAACQYVLVAQDKSLDLVWQINTDHVPYYLLLT